MRYSFPLLPSALLLGYGWLSGTCSAAAEPVAPPSKVENPVPESALPTLRLTPRAVQRLGITTSTVARKPHARTRLFPGLTRLPLGEGKDALAPAPVAGPEELRKLAELQNTADGAINAARAALSAAVTARRRAESLTAARAGSGRSLDDAKASEVQAETALNTATQARALLGRPASEAASASQRWIAVALAPTDTARLDLSRPARIRLPGSGSGQSVPAPLTARPATSLPGGGVEIFFELREGSLTIGQQVEVELAEKAAAGADDVFLTVPWPAVVYDAAGGSWVYERREAEAFVRHRISVLRVVNHEALLVSGPAEGVPIVVTGVAELFGAEFGGFK